MQVSRWGTLLLCLVALSLEGANGQTWVQKIGGSGLGNPLAVNPVNHDIVYAAAGTARIYISRNQGYSWGDYGNIVPGGGIIKSICVSPRDTLKLLAGVEMSGGSFDQIARTTDGGVTWTDVWGGTFSYYGQPIEFAPEHPDTVYTMGSDTLWRSTDFGATWDTVSRVTGFNTWCDASIRPDSARILLLGDNASGIWKTTDAGVTWAQKYSTFGEIPSIAIDPLAPHVAYASKYGGGGGIVKTTNGGETWFNLSVPSGTRDTWWITCSHEYPGYVYYGTYTGDTAATGIYLSRNSGATWQRYAVGLWPSAILNYGLVVVDSLTVIAFQGNGISKLQFPTAAHLSSPNGGEHFQTGTVHPISWTSSYLPLVNLEYSTNDGSTWSLIADSLLSAASPYLWSVPAALSSACRVRVADTRFSGAADASDSSFTISSALISISAPGAGVSWQAGASKEIVWSSAGVAAARLDYSVDSGATWMTVTQVAAGSGSYLWTVPDLPSNRCRVRLTDTGDSLVWAQSGLFTIAERRVFTARIRVRDSGNISDTLAFGAGGGATDGIDPPFGETERSPKPPAGTFDARWRVAPGNGTNIDIRDTLSPVHDRNLFTVEFQPGPSGYPVTLSWSVDSLGAGTFILRDTLTRGLVYSADMRRESTLVVTNASVTALEILECASVSVDIAGNGAWTLVSLPVVTGDRRKSTLFPYALSPAYSYGAGYTQRDTLEYGQGYWIKTEQTSLQGCALPLDTIHVKTGWNIIGSLSGPVALGAITAVPESLVASSFYGYQNGYFTADSILPGRGYWVKAKSDGLLVESAAAEVRASSPRKAPGTALMSSLRISDGAGGAQELRFGPSVSVARDEMPPPPPEGGFDARFSSSSMMAGYPENFENELHFPISVNSVGKRLFFSWHVENEEKFTYILSEIEDTRVVSQLGLTSDGNANFTHHSHSSFDLTVRRTTGTSGVPHGYSMGELYPNPFNPTTRCTFSLPVEARVSITVYSLLGRVVATLINETRAPGVYAVEWNAGGDGDGIGSGVYYVRMTVSPDQGPGFTRVEKVLYLK